jgi:hypothetical protein
MAQRNSSSDSAAGAPTLIAAARQSKQQLQDDLRACKQRGLDQEAVIDTMRKLFVALVVKHGVAGTLHIDRKDIEAIGTKGELKIQEMPTGIVLAARVGGIMPPGNRPVLVKR